METTREKQMKGVLLFAFNSGTVDYYSMAVATAKRINHFLNLPVSIVTNKESLPSTSTYTFDKVILADAQTSNKKDRLPWYNKGRYRAYDLTPYDETIVLDTDYLVNSNKLLKIFDFYDDFCCHDTTSYILIPDATQEHLSIQSFKTLWATVIVFRKTPRTKQIFECLEMVQTNYEHYENIYKFLNNTYRNDYGLSIALRIANGHLLNKQDIIPWNLIHAEKTSNVIRNSSDEFNTEYTIIKNKDYTILKDCDFHMMNKENFMEVV